MLDYGNFERIQGNQTSGRRHVSQALDIIESMPKGGDRFEKEILVTESFMPRFDLEDPQHASDAIDTLRMTARKLHGYKKKAYELANLRCLIGVFPFYSFTSMPFQNAT